MIDITTNIDFVKLHTIDNIKHTEIRDSKLHGFGLFAMQSFFKDSILTHLDGQIVDNIKYKEIIKSLSSDIGKYKNYFLMECNILDKNTYLVRAFRTKYSYINHSRKPNVKIIKYPLRIIVIKDISVNDEIVIDYRMEDLSEEYLNRDDKKFL